VDIIDHIGIRVDDLKEAERWYLERLKAEVTFRSDKYIRLKVGNTNIALIDKVYYPWAHVAILVDDKEDLPKQGYKVKHRDGTIGVYVEDPFGNYLEYIWYSQDQSETFLK
jgi:catechol 2,3-dioxygenase-like lactoylglutathione lyase family enzyme|tara:strand:+ start:450 stop:782 length:333 start_codon:yes stop_codon:yes gene_type:complete